MYIRQQNQTLFDFQQFTKLNQFQQFQKEMGDDDKGARLGVGLIYVVLICVVTFATLPFIICHLVYAYNDDSICLNQQITKYSINFTLKTWLLADGWGTFSFLALLYIIAPMGCIYPIVGAVFAIIWLVLFLIWGIFKFAWLIIGAVMFWGQLNPDGTCGSSLNSYMWAYLIISFLSLGLNYISPLGGGRAGSSAYNSD